MTLGLQGRTALVSGGTRGLGLAVARTLCGHGCHVYLNYAHDVPAAQRAAAGLSRLPGTATPLAGDLSTVDGLAPLVERVRDERGRLDIFVHAAVSYHPVPDGQPTPEDFHADLAVALYPLLTGAPALAKAMAGGPGRIVAVSSIGARRVVPAYASLGIAKAALESQVRYLAVALAPDGITVNAVSTSKLDEGPEYADDPTVRMLTARTPAGRLTRAGDVADVVALLCTDQAAWIHGQVITADGGLTLRA